MSEVQDLAVQVPRDVSQHWGWLLAFGIGLVILGIVAVGRSVAATVVSMVFFGWLLAMAAGIEIVQAIMVGRWAGFFLHLLAAILYGVAGFILISRPLRGAEVITLFMGAIFIIGGLFELLAAPLVQLPAWAGTPSMAPSRSCSACSFWRNGRPPDCGWSACSWESG
jgi:uncharacterized membrane protein HdeD (DUF308 family)